MSLTSHPQMYCYIQLQLKQFPVYFSPRMILKARKLDEWMKGCSVYGYSLLPYANVISGIRHFALHNYQCDIWRPCIHGDFPKISTDFYCPACYSAVQNAFVKNKRSLGSWVFYPPLCEQRKGKCSYLFNSDNSISSLLLSFASRACWLCHVSAADSTSAICFSCNWNTSLSLFTNTGWFSYSHSWALVCF